MKHLYLFLLSSSVALACVATNAFALVTWSTDCPTSFTLTICGTGPIGGGDFTSPSGQWDVEDRFDVTGFFAPLRFQQCGSSVEFTLTGGRDSFPSYARCESRNGDTYQYDNTWRGPGDALPGWAMDSCITYKVTNPHNPNTWQWTIECHGAGPDLRDSGCRSHDPCGEPAVPEPGSLWLVGVGLCGLAFAYRHGVGRRVRS
jgi:hypothetical protein